MIAEYKTTQNVTFSLEGERKIRTGIVNVEVFFPKFDGSSKEVYPKGNYYTIVDGIKRILAEFTGSIPFQTIFQIEDFVLQDFSQQRNVIDIIEERTKEFTLLRIDEEYGADNEANFGINSGILEEVIN